MARDVGRATWRSSRIDASAQTAPWFGRVQVARDACSPLLGVPEPVATVSLGYARSGKRAFRRTAVMVGHLSAPTLQCQQQAVQRGRARVRNRATERRSSRALFHLWRCFIVEMAPLLLHELALRRSGVGSPARSARRGAPCRRRRHVMTWPE